MYCISCGSGIVADTKFCRSCGTAVAAPPPPGTSGPPATEPTAAAPPPPAPSPSLGAIQTQLGALRQKGSATAWLLLAGSVAVAISSFFPWVMGTINDGLGDSYSETLGLSGPGRFCFVALAVAIVAIGWPVFSGGSLARKRTIGLSVVVGVLTLLAVILSATASHTGKTSGLSQPGPGFGTVLCWIAILAVWIGVIRVWTKRRALGVVAS